MPHAWNRQAPRTTASESASSRDAVRNLPGRSDRAASTPPVASGWPRPSRWPAGLYVVDLMIAIGDCGTRLGRTHPAVPSPSVY